MPIYCLRGGKRRRKYKPQTKHPANQSQSSNPVYANRKVDWPGQRVCDGRLGREVTGLSRGVDGGGRRGGAAALEIVTLSVVGTRSSLDLRLPVCM
ncbi:hypothetical protein BaRGS_00012474 [Batillaria attramentaria]|uniref:Uncharacterized protein n=1 Tax=Batillaria attramentaria TaxID=370345 RepID=A0ABD0LA49_9CAEN